MTQALLSDRAVLAVSGADAHTFLQGLITNDIRKVKSTEAIFAALLSPQGKFLFDFFIIEHEGKLLLDTDKARLPDLKKRLLMYRLRAKVEIEETPLQVAAAWGKESDQWSAISGQAVYADPRLPELGKRILYSPSAGGEIQGGGDYDQHRLALGIPEGAKDLTVDRSLILEYGYDELHAVDYAKGCYVGQEVTARTHHRATLRKFIHTVRADSPLPPPGTPVMAGDREVGEMCTSAGTVGLAHLRVEETANPLTAASVRLQASLPGWCKTSFSQSAK